MPPRLSVFGRQRMTCHLGGHASASDAGWCSVRPPAAAQPADHAGVGCGVFYGRARPCAWGSHCWLLHARVRTPQRPQSRANNLGNRVTFGCRCRPVLSFLAAGGPSDKWPRGKPEGNKTFAVCLHQIRGRRRSRKSLLAAGSLTAIKVLPFWGSADLFGKCYLFQKCCPF